MIFQQIRSAAIKLYYNDAVFLVDPWLRDSSTTPEVVEAKAVGRFISTPVIPLPMPVSKILEDVDYVLVSHMHSDHFTPDHLPMDMALIFQNETDMNAARKMGFTNVSCFCGDVLRLNGVTITRVDGQHGDTLELAERLGPVSGFVFEAENEKTVYVAGDTVYYDGVQKTIDCFHPAAGIVNACDAGDPTGRLIMNKEDVMALCENNPDTLVIASHMDAVSHARLTRVQLRADLHGTAFEKQVLIPEDGETIQI